MLDYLVTSKARRTLLALLWTQGRSGSVADLARASGLSFRSAHKELNGMRDAGLARCTRVGNATVFSAALDHPAARALRLLLDSPRATPSAARRPKEHAQVRAWMKAWGAPLEASAQKVNLPNPETVLVQGVKLAPHDASVARSLPLLVWKQRRSLDPGRLHAEALAHGEKHAVGFFLALTGTLANDPALVKSAGAFRDRRRKKLRDFFPLKSAAEAALAEERTPSVAREWQFRMNMTMETFSSTFRKFVENAPVQG